jgi:hypothetical protein
MHKASILVLLCVGCTFTDAQSAITGPEERNQKAATATQCSCPRINPTKGAVPVKSSATAFSNSPLSVDINGNLEIGANPTPNSSNGGLTMVGTLARSNILEIHNNYAVGVDLYTHSDEEFRAPYINLYKSRGIQTAPAPVMFTGYELDSIGGINFGGWDGSKYFAGSAAIYTQTDENWDDSHHGGHISIYGTNPGGNTQQIAQFGGVDPNSNPVAGNIIFYRPLTWGNNSNSHPGLFPDGASSPPVLHLRAADDSVDANLTAGALIETVTHTPSSSSDTGTTGQIAWDSNYLYVCVAPNTWKRAAIASW